VIGGMLERYVKEASASRYFQRRERRMTRSELEIYIRALADHVGLKDWRFELVDGEPDEEDDVAMVHPLYGRQVAQIKVRSDVLTNPPVEQRRTILHELIHCHMAPVDDQPRLDLLEHLGQQAYNIFMASYRRNLEYAVDAMTEAWAHYLPLPIEQPWIDNFSGS